MKKDFCFVSIGRVQETQKQHLLICALNTMWSLEVLAHFLHFHSDWSLRLGSPLNWSDDSLQWIIVQELCESRGGCPELSVLTSLLVSVDVKNCWTVLRHWSQLVPSMSTDIRGHWASLHHQLQWMWFCIVINTLHYAGCSPALLSVILFCFSLPFLF